MHYLIWCVLLFIWFVIGYIVGYCIGLKKRREV